MLENWLQHAELIERFYCRDVSANKDYTVEKVTLGWVWDIVCDLLLRKSTPSHNHEENRDKSFRPIWSTDFICENLK